MQSFSRILSICIITCILKACNYADEVVVSKPQMVIEGYIDSGGFPIVMLTTTVPISTESQKFDSLANHLLRWAKVTVKDDEQSVILTGKMDRNYFPPFIYTTSRLRGRTGHTYSLEVDYGDYHATAVTTIPECPQVDSFRVVPTAVDSLCQIVVCFTDTFKQDNYYKAFVRMGRMGRQWHSSYLGLIPGEIVDGYAELVVNKAWLLDGKEYAPSFNYRDTLSVKFAKIDTQAYRFWKDYEDHLNNSRNPLFPLTHNLHSNINGGIGCWYGCGAVTKSFVLEKYRISY